MKKLLLSCLVLLLLPAIALAVRPRPAKPYVAPTAIPATIDGFVYVTGLPHLDKDKYKQRLRYRGYIELGDDGLAFKRTRARQDGRKGVEDVDIVRVPYAAIEKLYFGEEAIRLAATGTLPTAAKKVFDARPTPPAPGPCMIY